MMRNFMTCTLQQVLFRVIKSQSVRLTGHVARMGDVRNAYRSFVGKPERKVGDVDPYGTIVLEWILGK